MLSTRNFFISLIFLLLTTWSAGTAAHAQSAYARKMVDTLSSPSFWGRGYTKDGMLKAAHFIAEEMKAMGLQPLEAQGYLQPFPMSINTFPGNMQLSINGHSLQAGRDFLVGPRSKGVKGNFRMDITVEAGVFINREQKVMLVVEPKLVWTPSQEVEDFTQIMVKDSLGTQPINISVDIEQQFLASFTANNVIGMLRGKEQPDSFIVITAHYDHLGGMGRDVYFPGANDNASGVALMLQLARHFTHKPAKYSIIFIAFAAEEAGLLGSKHFAAHPSIPLNKIKFLLNLDLMGNGEEGITVVNAPDHPQAFDQLVQWNKQHKAFSEIQSRNNAANSDHYPFTEKGVPAFFIYTKGGSQAYHDIFDRAEQLPLLRFNELESMLKAFINGI